MYYTTLNRTVAMAGGYIGEVFVLPNPITVAVRRILKRKPPRPILIYYYGKRDERLSKKFGYPTKEPTFVAVDLAKPGSDRTVVHNVCVKGESKCKK